MEILKYPHSSLFTQCEPVTVFGKELKIIIESMLSTMRTSGGMGLAANQVGLKYRIFVMEGPNGEDLHFINPKISWRSIAPANKKEGCLSAPGDFLVLQERADMVRVDYQDHDGRDHKKVFDGIWAVCVQHEIDHLDGKAFIQSKSIPKAKRRELLKKWGV
jgi:peptide deformylase